MHSSHLSESNGYISESTAHRVLESQGYDVTYINQTIDFILNNKYYIEVKSCQHTATDNSHTTRLRSGRFTLDQYQHRELLRKDGVYLFIVNFNNICSQLRFIHAKQLKFQTQYSWKKLFKIIDSKNPHCKYKLQCVFTEV